MSKILMCSSEVAPFAKTGGLGDVLGALPQALAKLGNDVRVVLPKYGCIPNEYKEKMEFLFFIYIPLGWRRKYCGVFELKRDGVTYYFIDNEYYFGDPYLYKWNDLERFAFYDKASLEILKTLDFKPDIIHAHDWQAGMIPVLLNAYYVDDDFYRGIKTVFTIHNLAYQGIYSADTVADFFSLSPEYFTNDKLEFHGCANLLKGGIVYSDYVTTVSPTYAEEIKTPLGGERLDGLLFARSNSLRGIINGIDYSVYNPSTDPYIFETYNAKTVIDKKKINKMRLQEQLGLPVDGEKAMVGLVSRLVSQKGLDLIAEAMGELMSLDIQFVAVGTGEARYEEMLRDTAWHNPSKLSANIMFSNELAHKVYAAADLFLMPSMFEPCGLSQLISFAYGTIPIVRETGGLKDTVNPYNKFTGEGTGFSFAPYNAHDMMHTLRMALELFADKKIWNKLVKSAMSLEFSWDGSAKEYEQIYNMLIGNR
ncbi:MAG: glycogen synthase GlgA [Clostridia bacterium]|nr:glycogen synthase GlgA [Clostridia bacterium]